MSRGACEVGPGYVICYATCWACKFDQCYDPPTWHTWADDEDIEHARKTGQPDPSDTRCACRCADGPRGETPEPNDGPDLDAPLGGEPCPECGEAGACAWDAEGRPLIHALSGEAYQ